MLLWLFSALIYIYIYIFSHVFGILLQKAPMKFLKGLVYWSSAAMGRYCIAINRSMLADL